MRKHKLYELVLICAFIFTAIPVFAVDANQILKQVDEKLMPESYESYRKLINEEPSGRKREYTFYSVKKGIDKIAMYYLAPASEKGRATLRLGENMWLYIPNVGKPIRITSMQSITGGVFNNADIMQIDYQAEYNASIKEETKKEYILELKAKSKTVAYDNLKMWVAKEGLILEKIECYGVSGMLIKTLEFKEVKDFGEGLVRPSVVETNSPLYKGYRSYMIYQKIKSRKLSDEVFTLNYLPKLGELR
ncbi:MAG TPA: outer membrane lipoprotein-sorting protein [Candidatus Margulisbacteria bacterium]|nr:MAG: outer membrane lipoprotein-sorting protein [Bacteroidetes bacterium GWF2_43_11]OGI11308.1 MAG: outer membrane lipoprotein-sorting protein [Candidatus Margulisbacteria bacterium GWE2_39_32]HCT83695.1 outer membrane lipoprotein-sorting protein [Candidatus Margulisiibacteriota bacterium]